jgi:hypothetical protein
MALSGTLAALGLSACGSSSALSNGSAIDSSAERGALQHAFVSAKDIPAKDRTPIINCLIAGLKAHGIATHGEFEKSSNLPLTRQLSATCTLRVLKLGTTG